MKQYFKQKGNYTLYKLPKSQSSKVKIKDIQHHIPV